jgi:hypothetical protein
MHIYKIHVRGLDIDLTIEADTFIQAQFKIMRGLTETEQQRVKGFELIPYPMKNIAIERRNGTENT